MRILYITHTFPPEPGPSKRPLQQAICLQNLGHKVTILTTMPHYPYGRIHPGYRWRAVMRRTMNGVDVVRVWSPPASNRGKVLRMFSHASFGLISIAAGMLLLDRHDLVIASVPNIATDLGGLAVAHLRRVPVLLELRDLLPDNLAMAGVSGDSWLFRGLAAYYRWILRHVDWIAVPGAAMAEVLTARGFAADRILLLPHAADPELFCEDQRDRRRRDLGLCGRFVVMYAGSFSPYYDVPNLVEAAARLQACNPQVQMVLLGAGPDAPRVRDMIARRGLSNVLLLNAVSSPDACAWMPAADLFLTSIAASHVPDFHLGHLTTKTCEYLMAARPILSVEGPRLLGGFLESIGAGMAVPAGNPGALAAAIDRFARQPDLAQQCGRQAGQYARANLQRQAVVAEFERQLTRKMQSLTNRRNAS